MNRTSKHAYWEMSSNITSLSKVSLGSLAIFYRQTWYYQQEMLRVVTIVIICSTLASHWKFHYFRRPIQSIQPLIWELTNEQWVSGVIIRSLGSQNALKIPFLKKIQGYNSQISKKNKFLLQKNFSKEKAT